MTRLVLCAILVVVGCGKDGKGEEASVDGTALHEPPVDPAPTAPPPAMPTTPPVTCNEIELARIAAEVGATLPADGAGDVPATRVCRTIATKWTSGSTVHACAWDGTGLTCAAGWGNCPVRRDGYHTVRDLVWEGEAIGRERKRTASSQVRPQGGPVCDPVVRAAEPLVWSPGLTWDFGFMYDGEALAERWDSVGVTNNRSTTETTLRRDAALRVTLATRKTVYSHRPSGDRSDACSLVTYLYEPGRITTRRYAATAEQTAAVPASEEVTLFDERGLVVEEGGVRREITATQEICLE